MKKQLKEIIRSVIREEFISELSKNDVHVKQIMKFYDNGTYSTKKAVSIFVSGKTNASRNQILDDLADMGYNDALEVMDHFKLKKEGVNEADVVPGGLAKGLSLNDIAEKHGVSVDMMVGEFKKGIQIEMEHTTDREVAKEITLDHLFEDPKYYDKLAKVEEYIDDKGVERVGAALPQTEEDPIKEGLLKEDIATQLIFSLILIAQAAMIGGSLAKMSSVGSGYNLGPIDSIKKWWNDKKTDNTVKSIVNKIKTDPELIDFLKLPASQQRGKFRNMVATKLSSDELKYLNRINKSDVRQNESMNEDSSFFSKLKKGINVVGKFPPYKEFIVVSTDGKKSASLKDLKTGKTIDIYSTNNYKLKESVNESTDCGCGCE